MTLEVRTNHQKDCYEIQRDGVAVVWFRRSEEMNEYATISGTRLGKHWDEAVDAAKAIARGVGEKRKPGRNS